MKKITKVALFFLIFSMIFSLTACSKINSIKNTILAVTADESQVENNENEEEKTEIRKGTATIVGKNDELGKTKNNNQSIQDLINKAKGEGTNEEKNDIKNEENEENEDEEDNEEKEKKKNPDDDDLVLIKDYIPGIYVSLPYATTNNFCKTKLYDNNDAYLRYGTIKKLQEVQKIVKADGYSLKIWDGYRPKSAQEQMWEIVPDETYVANPSKGSSHNRGNTVDLTLVNNNGEEIPMPSEFDEFSDKADRDYSDVSDDKAKNAIYLENIMVDNGFKPYSGEWWHFTDKDEYPFVDY